MTLGEELAAAKAEVARIEAEIATMPGVLLGKTEQEMIDIWHAIEKFFKGSVPPPAP